MLRRFHAAVLAIVAILGSFGGAIAAQTPVPVGQDIPTSCLAEPVGVLSLLAVLNDVEDARFDAPVSSVPLAEIVPGNPVSPEDMQAIDVTTQELVGCVNSGQVLSAIGLLTERFQSRLVLEVVEGDGLDAIVAQLPLLATETAEGGGIQAIPIRTAWYPDSGEKSIVAILEPVAADPAQQRSFLVTYVYSIDRWLIDDVQLVEGS